MQLSDLSVRRPVFAAVLAILLCVAGIVAFFNLTVREFPDTDPPIVSVQTTYTGAAATVVETRVTEVIEDALAGIAGIQTITSTSQDGRSDINVEFNPSVDIDTAANDVRDRVGSVVQDLPEDILAPEIRKVDADAQPIMFVVVSRPGWTAMQVTDYIDRNLADRFSSLDGVSRVNVFGEALPAMRIWIDPTKLTAVGLTTGDIESALRAQNVELPAGRIEARDQNVTIRVNRPFVTPQQFAQLVIGRGSNGYLVRLADVARVEQGPEDPYNRFRYNGSTAQGIGIVRQSGANTLAVADSVKALIKQVEPGLPAGMSLNIGSDDSLFIGRAIDNVYETLAEAALLVVAVIFLFLGSARATLIPSVTVPVCLLATCAVMWMLGLSLNLLTLLAFVLAIGLVVDDAIVVLENVYHRIEEGEKPLVAAFLGSRQVGFAIISTTLVVCAVFIPVMFLAGQTGLLFRELAITMIAAIAFSGFVALSLAPMLCSVLLKPHSAAGGRGRLTQWVDDRFRSLENRYSGWLDGALRRPLIPLLLVGVFLALAAFAFTRLDSELAPGEDTGVIQLRATAAEGTGFEQMTRYMEQAEEKLLPLVGKGPIRGMVIRIPGSFGTSEDFNSGAGAIFLKPWEERDQSTLKVAGEVTGVLNQMPGVRGVATPRSGLGRGRSQPISLVIAGSTYEELVVARDRILAAARDNPGIVNLDSDYKENKPQMGINVDIQRAGDLGVSVSDVGNALQSLLGSRRVGTYTDRGKEYRVIVQADAPDRANEESLQKIFVRSRTGQLVPLSSLVTVSEVSGARTLGRYNKLRAITLDGSLAPGYSLGNALQFLENVARQSPEVSAIGYRGESQSYKEAGSSILIVFGFTILVVYLLLAAQFESFVHPAVIVSTVPLAVAGGAIGLLIMGQTLNLYSQIGIVMLVGLAAKNGILIVEFANQLRDAGEEMGAAIRQASVRRLRPILMTSIATVVGAVPLIVKSGAGAASRASIGTVVVFGVTFATLITLFMVPIIYARMARSTGSPNRVSRQLDADLPEGEEAEVAFEGKGHE